MNSSFIKFLALVFLLTAYRSGSDAQEAAGPNVLAYSSIQAAIDENPGKMIFVPPGDYLLTNAVVIRHSGSGLYGFGRLIQANTNAPIIEVREASDVRLRDLTLTRTSGALDSPNSAVRADNCLRLRLEGLRVRNNRSPSAAVALDTCDESEVVRCHIENYMTLSVDDRVASPHYGYAFNCIDGTGIAVQRSREVLLQGNRVIERELRPTRELKERHRLGQFIRRAPKKGTLLNQKTWDAGYVNNWHQGSGIVVSSPERTAHVRIIDNHVENGAQGIDIHADFVTVTGNQVINCFMGLKAMHGSRHVLIANNQFVRNDLWSIGLMPGASSHAALPASDSTPARSANVDAGHIVANNIITDFGYGDSGWIWGTGNYTTAPIFFDKGQEPDDPPLRDVVVTGNLVYDSGREGVLTNGLWQTQLPRYRYAVHIDARTNGPQGLRFHGNLFQPGTEGISNQKLDP